MSELASHIRASIERSAAAVASLSKQADRIAEISGAVVGALSRGNKVLTCGHGGSAAAALHMSEELLGRFDADRRPLPAVSLVADPTLLTCIANDYGFGAIFERQVEGLGRAGDVLVVFSTSGKGEGLLRAVRGARRKEMTSVALLGKGGGALRGEASMELIVASEETARVQEAHDVVMHVILEAVDRAYA